MIRIDSDSLWPLLKDLKRLSLISDSSGFQDKRNSMMSIDGHVVQLLIDEINSLPETVFLPFENSATSASRAFKYDQEEIADEKDLGNNSSSNADDDPFNLEKLEKDLNAYGKDNLIQELTKNIFSENSEQKLSSLEEIAKSELNTPQLKNGYLQELKSSGIEYNNNDHQYANEGEIPN